MNLGIEQVGFGLNGDIGGIPRQTYYTPDGRTIRAIAQMRDWVRKDDKGKVIGSGTRDANLDCGWLLQKPTVLKVFCPTCDKWHDTKAGVKACKVKQGRMIAMALRSANKEEAKKNVGLEQQVAQLQAMVAKLMEGKVDGPLFQSKATQPAGENAGRSRRAKKGVQS